MKPKNKMVWLDVWQNGWARVGLLAERGRILDERNSAAKVLCEAKLVAEAKQAELNQLDRMYPPLQDWYRTALLEEIRGKRCCDEPNVIDGTCENCGGKG